MVNSDWIQGLRDGLSSHVYPSQDLALFGFAMLSAIALGAVLLGVAILVGGLRWVRDFLRLKAARRDNSVGYRVLIAGVTGSAGASRWLARLADEHLSDFSFGAPLHLVKTGRIRGGLAPKSIAKARKMMVASDADMMIWANRVNGRDMGLEVYGLSRGGGLRPDEMRPFTLFLPGKKKDRRGRVDEVTAYLLAKKLQPALEHPQSFRPERMKVLAERLSTILEESPDLPIGLKEHLEGDFCASSVHVAEQDGDIEGLEKVISLRRSHVEAANSASNPARVNQARMDLGRALLARAEKQFDQKVVQEAIRELSQVVEALRANPNIQQAQSASDAMFKAQTMLENRKRFALNFE